MQKNLLYTLLLVLCFFSCTSEQPEDLSEEISAIENGLLAAIQVKDDPSGTFKLEDRMAHHKVPGVSIAVVADGRLRWAKGYGVANTDTGQKVEVNTLFQAGSISKPLAALAALKLVEEGKVDLDTDVNTYLKDDWKVAENRFTENEKVTLRRLLTHTAGMTVHGFPGYQQDDPFPTVIEVLNGAGNTPGIFVDTLPGSIWRYSGGGYTVMEKMVEDVSGQPLEVYIAEQILRPMGLTASTYEQPLPESRKAEASAAYDDEGQIIKGWWHNYPEQAAAGLWTNPTDLATYCLAIQAIAAGKTDGILQPETIEKMLTKHKNDWGLGPSLQKEGDSLLFRHGGKNAGFTNEMVAFARQGKAVIIMTSADNGGRLIGEVMRSISAYYGWDISKPRVVETVKVPEADLQKLAGKYLLDFQVPDIGDYFVDIAIRDGKIEAFDPNNNETNVLVPLSTKRFLDLDLGDEIEIQGLDDGKELALLWNGRFRFVKVAD